jgi:glycosyltransferase involved in cell wall biosynthesis
MNVLLYCRALDLRSGTGRLVRMQVQGLHEHGATPRVVCGHGGLKYFLRTGIPVRYSKAARMRGALARGGLVVDHSMQFPDAAVVFVHNVAAEAQSYLARADWSEQAVRETRFFADLEPDVPVVANSRLVKHALTARFGVAPERIVVHYPGVDTEKFAPAQARAWRARARRALGVDDDVPLIGLVTSGDFAKRGLDLFLAAAERIVADRPAARFLVVGSKRLPASAAAHPLVVASRVAYRPKNGVPERWMAALDLFMYPACFEEFGMTLMEAQALGVPVLTSRRVGAAECLPKDYDRWLLDAPDVDRFAAGALHLLADESARQRLASAGSAHAAAIDHRRYAAATAGVIMAQKRRLK